MTKLLPLLAILFCMKVQGQVSHIAPGQVIVANTNNLKTIKVKYVSWDSTACPHIYVAVIPDTVVWDKTPRNSPILASGVITRDSIPDLRHWYPPAPHTQKIVCILCHKQTEQVVKEFIDTVAILSRFKIGSDLGAGNGIDSYLSIKGDSLMFIAVDTTKAEVKFVNKLK